MSAEDEEEERRERLEREKARVEALIEAMEMEGEI